jgi:hypothetical protein
MEINKVKYMHVFVFFLCTIIKLETVVYSYYKSSSSRITANKGPPGEDTASERQQILVHLSMRCCSVKS